MKYSFQLVVREDLDDLTSGQTSTTSQSKNS